MLAVRIRSALLFSSLVHLLLFLLMFLSLEVQRRNFAPPEFVEVRFLPENQRIVESEAGEISETAAPDAFRGEKTRRVKEQTVARGGETLNEASSTKTQSKSLPQVQTPPLSRFGLPIVPSQKQLPPDTPDFVIMGENTNPQTREYIQGMKESETTALNTKEYVYYSYFQRIRERLNQAWKPILKDKIFKIYRRGRHLASNNDYLTKTLVTLDRRGEVVRVRVLEESGTRDLDEAAVKAFNKAGPFPNPPKGLMNSQGEVDIRWDFVLKT